MWFFRLCVALARVAAKILYRLTWEGTENIPQTGRAVIVANHTKNVDPGLIAVAIRRPFYSIGKKELFNNRIAGAALRKLGTKPVSRDGKDVSAIDYAVSLLKDEQLFLVFPEGTRNEDQSSQLENVKAGAVAMAVKGRAPMIPIELIAPDGVHFRSRIHIVVGKPIEYYEFGVTEFKSKQFRDGSRIMVSRMRALKGNADEQKIS